MRDQPRQWWLVPNRETEIPDMTWVRLYPIQRQITGHVPKKHFLDLEMRLAADAKMQTFYHIPYSCEQKHVLVSDMSRLEAPASWPSLLV